jgi:hypothetical protein
MNGFFVAAFVRAPASGEGLVCSRQAGVKVEANALPAKPFAKEKQQNYPSRVVRPLTPAAGVDIEPEPAAFLQIGAMNAANDGGFADDNHVTGSSGGSGKAAKKKKRRQAKVVSGCGDLEGCFS